MRLWRLSGVEHADKLDGGYGLHFDGRWNSAGRPVTYAATSPSLCVLEKLVHIEDLTLLPDLALVVYDAPEDIELNERALGSLPGDWRKQEALTQRMGNEWLDGLASPLLLVPSAVVPVRDSPDLNVLLNPRHPDSGRIKIERVEPFELDLRLL